MSWSIGSVVGGSLIDAVPVFSKDERFVLCAILSHVLGVCLYVTEQISECMT